MFLAENKTANKPDTYNKFFWKKYKARQEILSILKNNGSETLRKVKLSKREFLLSL
jgi:hypothetical protein